MKINCGGCGLFVLILNVLLGGVTTQYCLEHWLHKPVGFWWCALIGLFAGQFAVPAAIITWAFLQAGVVA